MSRRFKPWTLDDWTAAMNGLCPLSHPMRAWQDPSTELLIVQHGDNPEAVLTVPFDDLLRREGGPKMARLWEWVTEVHAYETLARP